MASLEKYLEETAAWNREATNTARRGVRRLRAAAVSTNLKDSGDLAQGIQGRVRKTYGRATRISWMMAMYGVMDELGSSRGWHFGVRTAKKKAKDPTKTRPPRPWISPVMDVITPQASERFAALAGDDAVKAVDEGLQDTFGKQLRRI